MQHIAVFDIGAGLVILILAIYGLVKGIVRLVLGIAGIALGWFLGLRYCEPLAVRMGASPPTGQAAGPDLRRMAAFALIFVAVCVAVSLIAWLITKALGAAKLGGLNRLAGAGAGVLVAILLVCAATVPLVAMWPPDGGWPMKSSYLAPYALAGGEYLKVMAPEPMRSRFTEASKAFLAALSGGPAPAAAPPVSGPKPAPSRRPR